MLLLLSFLSLVQSNTNCTFSQLTFSDLNLTSEKQFKDLLKKVPLFLLGVSAKWCRYCCHIEEKYEKIYPGLNSRKLKLVRADLSTQSYLSKFIDKNDALPHLYIASEGVLKRYEYSMDEYIFEYLSVFSSPHQVLSTGDELLSFLSEDSKEIKVVGFIFDQEEFLKHYQKARIELIDWPHTSFAVVTDKSLIKSLKTSGFISYFNCILHDKGSRKFLDLEYDKDIVSFLSSHSVDLVQELTPTSFQVFKTTGNPMLVLFADSNSLEFTSLIETYEKAARDFEKIINFVWMEGTTEVSKEKRKSVGLVTEKLPAMAFNLLDGRVFPFDESKNITLKAIKHFCANFLENKLKQGVKTPGFKGKNLEIEQKFRNTKGITMNELDQLVFQDGTDVMLLVYESNNEKSLTIAPNFNKAALRFKELNFPLMKVYKIDADNEPVQTVIGHYVLPAVLFFPAFHKNKPYIQYTGEGKAVQLMFFAQKYADIKFQLPELPHLSPDQVEAYWQQVGELPEERRNKVAKANEERDWNEYF
jgi:hypothetical protein